MRLGFGEIHPSSPWLSPHFLEAGTIGEYEGPRQTTQPVQPGPTGLGWVVNQVLSAEPTHA